MSSQRIRYPVRLRLSIIVQIRLVRVFWPGRELRPNAVQPERTRVARMPGWHVEEMEDARVFNEADQCHWWDARRRSVGVEQRDG